MAGADMPSPRTVVIALGGNAILQPGQVGSFEEQLVNIDAAMRRIAELVRDGWRVVLTWNSRSSTIWRGVISMCRW